MTLWYDVSDLNGWTLPHLTGIQRTTVGILDGLVGIGVGPRLAGLDIERGTFEAIEPADLPAAIRRHLPWAPSDDTDDAPLRTEHCPPTFPEACSAPPAAPGRPGAGSRRRRARDVVYGTSPAAADLRTALREFKASSRRLRATLARWTVARCREACGRRFEPERTAALAEPAKPPVPPGPDAASLAPPATRVRAVDGPLAGDVLLSLGASWAIPGHANAVASLRARGVRVVRMIYDLIPTLKPHWVDEAATRILTAWVGEVLAGSDRVLTISEFSRGEIERYARSTRLSLPPISVVRLGDVLAAINDPPPPRRIPGRPFFLCVSNLDIRKNHRLLYDAWSVLAARRRAACPDLVCVGLPNPHAADLVRELRRDPDVGDRIHLLHGVDDAELAWYYRSCVATIYASRYEGWGLPVAESLGHGRLCLASNATSIPEISPDLPAFFDPFDLPGLVTLVERALDDPAWVQDREADIRARFQATSWRHTAGQVVAAAAATDRSAGVQAA